MNQPSITQGTKVKILRNLIDSDENGQDRLTTAGSIGQLEEGYDDAHWTMIFANGSAHTFELDELLDATQCEILPVSE